MTSPAPRHVAAFACILGLFGGVGAACGSDGSKKGGANTTPVTATTSTAPPQSTTSAAPVATTPHTAVITVAPTTASSAAPTTAPKTRPTTAPTTVATAGAVTTVANTAAPADYHEVAPPKVPSTSAPVHADNSLPDGVYYATVTEGGDPPPAKGSVVFEVVQLFVGKDCTAHFGTNDPDLCVNDYGVETDPTSTIEVPLGSQFISVADAASQKSYRVSGHELYGLIHGDNPSAGAPNGYVYSGFGYFLTLSGGKVTRLEQWWTP